MSIYIIFLNYVMISEETEVFYLEDLRKVRAMINLAIYDKHEGETDRKITSNYKRDYVYKRGLSMRLGVFLGCIILVLIYYAYMLFVKDADVFQLIGEHIFIRMGIGIAAVLAIYTFFCSFSYRREYHYAEKRMDIYEKRISWINGQKSKHAGKNHKKDEVI